MVEVAGYDEKAVGVICLPSGLFVMASAEIQGCGGHQEVQGRSTLPSHLDTDCIWVFNRKKIHRLQSILILKVLSSTGQNFET